MEKMEAELYYDARCSLGEGAIWDDKSKLLYWVDINSATVFATDPVTGATEKRSIQGRVGDKIGTVVPRERGGLILAFESCIAAYDWETDSLESLVDFEANVPNNRANDGKCDPGGRLWVGSICPDKAPGTASLYRIDGDLTVHRMVAGVTVSNGIVWNGGRMYYIDTPTRRIDVFDYDNDTGAIENRRTCIEVPADIGHPDGMTIDETGRLWVALFGGGRVVCWDPVTTERICDVVLPVSNVTSCAFGGEHREELYITTARVGLDPASLESQTHAGSLYKAICGTRGVPSFRFTG